MGMLKGQAMTTGGYKQRVEFCVTNAKCDCLSGKKPTRNSVFHFKSDTHL